MKNFRVVLPILAIVLGIVSSFASQRTIGELGYSRWSDVPGQPSQCQARIYCDNIGIYTCSIFVSGVGNVALYNVACSIPLTRF